jgi:hypothetical protein
VNVLEVASTVVVVPFAYHQIVAPAEGVADKFTVPIPQRVTV